MLRIYKEVGLNDTTVGALIDSNGALIADWWWHPEKRIDIDLKFYNDNIEIDLLYDNKPTGKEFKTIEEFTGCFTEKYFLYLL